MVAVSFNSASLQRCYLHPRPFLEDFFITYKKTVIQQGEFIESIIIPKPNGNQRLITHKMSKRYEDDISAVCMAINISSKNNKPESFKIAFGGMSGIPQRSKKLENFLKNSENFVRAVLL